MHFLRRTIPAVLGAIACWSAPAVAQRASRVDLGGDVVVGGEAERYLRYLELSGLAPMRSWTMRALMPGRSDSVANGMHAWRDRWTAAPAATGLTWRVLRPAARMVYNTTFPMQSGPGPTWTGRGLTAEVQGGITAQYKRVHVQIAPIAFVAQNSSFTLAPNGLSGDGQYADARFPGSIDAPQRFGAGAYHRIDPGNSVFAIDASRVAFGISTAAESWGPAREYPLVLGPNAGGFPHGFVATQSPLDLRIVRLNARIIAGKLSQSAFATVTDPPQRWAAALVASLTPKGVDGLEIGVSRFLEGLSANGVPTVQNVARLFSSGLQTSGRNNVPNENGLASAFLRWAFPQVGFEVYGEYLQEDYTLGLRRVVQFPDDYASYTIGMSRVFEHSANRMRAIKLELVNGEISASNRGERADTDPFRITRPVAPYVHGELAQGHTQHGLILGSPEAFGGAAWKVGVDQFDARGRMSLTLERTLKLDWLPIARADSGVVHPDVLWSVHAEVMRFRGNRDYTVSVTPTYEMNRNLVPGQSGFNLRLAGTVRGLR